MAAYELFKQLHYKQEQVEQALVRIGKLKSLLSYQLSDPENRVLQKQTWIHIFQQTLAHPEEIGTDASASEDVLGFHVPGRFDKILDVKPVTFRMICPMLFVIQWKILQRTWLCFFDVIALEGFMRNLIIRSTSTGEWMVTVVFHEDKVKREKFVDESSQNTIPSDYFTTVYHQYKT